MGITLFLGIIVIPCITGLIAVLYTRTVRLVFAGTPDTAVPSLDALVSSRHDVVAVVTRPDAPAGRGRRPRPSAVAQRADELGVDVLTPNKPSDPEFLEQLEQLAPDCVPVVAYGGLIARKALDIPQWGWVNLHFSVLPAWRGAAPVQRAIMAGDEVTGASVFSLVERLDAGPVLGTITERIRGDDTAGSLLQRLAQFGSTLLVDALDHIEDGDAGAIPQAADGVSYASKLTSEDAKICWHRPAFAVDRHIRGCTPSPGAWTELAGARLKLGPVSTLDTAHLAPGQAHLTKEAVHVGTASNDVELSSVQPAGKRPIPAPDWARGLAAETVILG